MTDEKYRQWLELVQEAVSIRNRIVASGEMATKTRVEDEMMQLHGMERYDAHNIMNHIKYHNLK